MSREKRFTPGDWRVVTQVGFDQEMGPIGETVGVSVGGRVLWLTHQGIAGKPDDYEQRCADAHVLAASRKLLEALELVWSNILSQQPKDSPLREIAEAAIAVAYGEDQ